MGYETVFLPTKELATNLYTYEPVESVLPIIAAVQQIVSRGVEQIAVVTIKLYYESKERADAYRWQAARSTAYFLENLRALVRKTDTVFLLAHSMYFVLHRANQEGGQIVQSRLWEALLWRVHNQTDGDIVRPCGMTIGHSAYPVPHANIDKLLEAAAVGSLRYDWQPEKSQRKAVTQPPQPPQQVTLSGSSHHTETEEDLLLLARKLGIPYLTFLPRKLPARVQRLVDPKLAQELHCYPLGRERNTLTVAMLDPQDRSALDRLQQETGLQIFPVLTHPQALQMALEQLL